MTTEYGQVFTRADIVSAVESVKAVSGVANTVSGGGGGLGDLERVLAFVERAVPLFEKAASTMMQMRGFEAGQQPNPETPRPYVDVEAISPPAPAPAPPPPVVVAPRISPIKVYSAALGALADLEKLDPDLTVKKALVMARDYKEMILPKIEELIPSLVETPDA
jgi:hypothetical protein